MRRAVRIRERMALEHHQLTVHVGTGLKLPMGEIAGEMISPLGNSAVVVPMRQCADGGAIGRGQIPLLDVTAGQFKESMRCGVYIPYWKGRGKGLLTALPSKRAVEMARRANINLHTGEG